MKALQPNYFITCSRILFASLCFLCLNLLLVLIYESSRLYPVVQMTLRSQCHNPALATHGWNGKLPLLNIRVWHDSFDRPKHFSIHYHGEPDDYNDGEQHQNEVSANEQLYLESDTLDTHGDLNENGSRTLRRSVAGQNARHSIVRNYTIAQFASSNLYSPETVTVPYNLRRGVQTRRRRDNDSPLPKPPPPLTHTILWGSHHKTGTYLASKLFAVLCARASWCCVFHVTRDSVHAVRHTLQVEGPAVVGHSQWAWYPEDLMHGTGSRSKYKFVHFYRDPVQKVLSGYRYHKQGVEAWTKRPGKYAMACLADLPRIAMDPTKTRSTNESAINIPNENTQAQPSLKSMIQVRVSSGQVAAYCQSVHLCEPCCRIEHQTHAQALHQHTEYAPRPPEYSLRSPAEYSFLCSTLGSTRLGSNYSLSEALRNKGGRVSKGVGDDDITHAPEVDGLLIEAGLSYYESLRMARIVNHTWRDPHTLNVNLDSLSADFETNIRAILRHIEYPVANEAELEDIVQELLFYDLRQSPLYRLSLSNPLVNHVDPAHLEQTSTLSRRSTRSSDNGNSGELDRRLSLIEQRDAMAHTLRTHPLFVQAYAPVYALLPDSNPIETPNPSSQPAL